MTTSNESESSGAGKTEKPVQKTKKAATVPKAKPKKAVPAAAPGSRDIGIDVSAPAKGCNDRSCPFHGTLSVRGQILEGDVVSDKMLSTIVVKRMYIRKNKKYERLEKRSSKYLVHSPPCMEAGMGDHVKIMECRPLSKQVSFVVVEVSSKGVSE